MVVAVAVTALAVDKRPGLVVVGHHGGVQGRVVVESAGRTDGGKRMGNLGRIAHRVLGYDVDRAPDSRGTEQRRASAAHHLDALNHVGGNLLQTVDAGKRREHRARVHQNLGIMAVKAVYAHLGKTAVLAIVLDAHSGLEIEAVGQRTRPDTVEQFGGNDIDKRSALPAAGLALGRGNDNLVEHEGVGDYFEIDLDGLVVFY